MEHTEIQHHILELDAVKVATRVPVPRALLAQSAFNVYEEVADHLLMELSTYVLQDHLATDQKVVFSMQPESWWQHTKAVHFPTFSRWLRRPPRYTREEVLVEVKSFASFPEQTMHYPESLGKMRRVQLVTHSRSYKPL